MYLTYLSRLVGEGWLHEMTTPDLPGAVGDIENWWDGMVNGQLIRVFAGSQSATANYDQGIVVVRVYDAIHPAQGGTPSVYETPARAGRVKLIAGVGSRLVVQASDTTVFYFAVVTQQWLKPDGTPLPSPTHTP